MEPTLLITSTKNDRIKAIQKLEKPSERRDKGVFVVEGKREISKAIASGVEIVEAYFCPQITSASETHKLFGNLVPLTQVSHHVFEAVAYRENKDGIIAIAKLPNTSLASLDTTKSPLLIVVENVEKPGNLGAILRTADAAGANGVIVCDPKTDVFNPNVIRASLGCVFTTPVVSCSNEEALYFLKTNGIPSFATTPFSSQYYFKENLSGPSAIIMGSEANGLSDFWLENASIQIKVPMLGKADSLNVSVCLAVVVYESVKQRLQMQN